MTHRRQNFMGGAAILAGAVAVTKLLGALYKIPLGNLLDREGMAHFYAAYNIYSLLLVLSTAGLPVALSRMVSRAAAQRRYGAVRRCLHLGLALLAALRPGSLIVDLASRPGGTDFAAARRLGLTALHALSLPAACAPETAGEFVAQTVCEILREREGSA